MEWYYLTSTEESESKVVHTFLWYTGDILYIIQQCGPPPPLYQLFISTQPSSAQPGWHWLEAGLIHNRSLLVSCSVSVSVAHSPAHHVNKHSPAVQYVWSGWHWGLEKSLTHWRCRCWVSWGLLLTSNSPYLSGPTRIGAFVRHKVHELEVQELELQ